MKLVECPRDAMQGIKPFISTAKKVAYINGLLKVGFDTIDFGSFVSPKAIPQMRDTVEVLKKLNLDDTRSSLLAIVANKRGAETACKYEQITYLGYPFSISETFQKRNTNATITESLERVKEIQELSTRYGKSLVIYISMAFGNPYNDPWNEEVALEWTHKLADMDIRTIALADTVGVARAETIYQLFETLIPALPGVEFGAHFHATPESWCEKVEAAWESGCRRFDTAIRGFGGCPMAKDELVGNMPTEKLMQWAEENDIPHGLDKQAMEEAVRQSATVFL